MRYRDTYRYIICGKCGKKWNIGKEQDTRYGYTCPECLMERWKEGERK